MPASIYLVSIGGHPNYGDELITSRWLDHLARVRPDTDVWLDTRTPGTAAALFAGRHPRLHTTDAVFRAVEDSLHGSGRSVEDIVTNLGTPLYDLQLLALREAGTIHLLGGGLINAVWPENRLIVRAMRAAAEISGARLVATGQGLMPDAGERFDGFEYVSVRDDESATLLGIDAGVDDALLEPPQPPSSRLAAASEVVVCVQSDAQEDGAFERLTAVARRCLETWDIPREAVRYLEAIPGADFRGYEALADLVAPDGFVPFSAMWRDGFAMGPQQVWITSRFHHHLVASAHGARGVALIGKQGYYDVKHGSIARLGSHWVLTDGTDFAVPALDQLRSPEDYWEAHRRKSAEAESG